jgi:hypothetical protein
MWPCDATGGWDLVGEYDKMTKTQAFSKEWGMGLPNESQPENMLESFRGSWTSGEMIEIGPWIETGYSWIIFFNEPLNVS